MTYLKAKKTDITEQEMVEREDTFRKPVIYAACLLASSVMCLTEKVTMNSFRLGKS